MEKVKGNSRVDIRLSSEEKKLLKDKAENCRLTLSEYLRRCGLNKQIPTPISQINAQAYLELGDIACQLESITLEKKISVNAIKSMTKRLRNLQRKAFTGDAASPTEMEKDVEE